MLRLLCLLTLTSHLLAQTGTIPSDRPRARPASALTGWADWEKGEELLKRIQVPPAPVLSAEDEAKTFKLAPGYLAELVACEPMVQCPIFFEFDPEGRYVELRFDTPARRISIISAYFPSGSSGEDRQQAKFRFLDQFYPHLVSLKQRRDFILCGDVNIAHKEIDLKNWKSNQKNSGFLPEERAWMTKLLEQAGMVDVYRQLHPMATDEAYTWWSNRGQAYAKNVGWRLDYHLATPELAAGAKMVEIYKDLKFSDHAPVTVGYDWSA